MKICIHTNDKDFLKAIEFLIDMESLNIKDNKIIIERNEISKIRAIVNLLLRLAKINEDLRRTLSEL